MWYNQIYNSKEMFTSFRYIKRLLIERFNIRQLKPTKKLQQTLYLVSKHVGIIAKNLFMIRRTDNVHDYDVENRFS